MNTNINCQLNDLIFAAQQRNLVYNSSFFYYSNQVCEDDNKITYNHPDGWIYKDEGSDGKIGFNAKNESCYIKKSSGDQLMIFSQMISEFPRWESTLLGQKVSAGVNVENLSDTHFNIKLLLNDGFNSSAKLVQIKAGEKQEIQVQLQISKSAKFLEIAIQSDTSNAEIQINSAFANLGLVAIKGLSCIVNGFIGERKQYMSTEIPPIEELSLCQPSKELPSTFTRLSSFLNGKFGFGNACLSMLPDMRGYFSRSWDNGAGVDPNATTRMKLDDGMVDGDHVGTLQLDDFKSHDHKLDFIVKAVVPAQQGGPITTLDTTNTSNTHNNGGQETRAKNIAELYTIKWA